ncbi:MAG TPA: hypothetical protein VKA46_40100 [Gemmataceae bacterium]|nr:hypothetical protein [Gemmataceae bacterium]
MRYRHLTQEDVRGEAEQSVRPEVNDEAVREEQELLRGAARKLVGWARGG